MRYGFGLDEGEEVEPRVLNVSKRGEGLDCHFADTAVRVVVMSIVAVVPVVATTMELVLRAILELDATHLNTIDGCRSLRRK